MRCAGVWRKYFVWPGHINECMCVCLCIVCATLSFCFSICVFWTCRWPMINGVAKIFGQRMETIPIYTLYMYFCLNEKTYFTLLSVRLRFNATSRGHKDCDEFAKHSILVRVVHHIYTVHNVDWWNPRTNDFVPNNNNNNNKNNKENNNNNQ